MFKKNAREEMAWKEGHVVCGIDEAGRGSLFGPVYVAGAIIPENTEFELLKDSKKLTPKQRLTAFEWIDKNCIYAYAPISASDVDKHNVYRATLLGMKRVYHQLNALAQLNLRKSIKDVVVDAMPLIIPTPGVTVFSMTKAEDKSSSVAAASIIAKVLRDKAMQNYHALYPAFKLEQHKGYGTQLHTEMIKEHGTSILHRKSFTKTITQNTEK